jgi:lactoylglutathione lyase
MKIDHIALWTYNLEGVKNFYIHYFDASSSEVYYNHSKEFSSYFIYFEGDCCIELMEMPKIAKSKNDPLKNYTGLSHFAIKTGSRTEVDRITEILKHDGFTIVSEPRITGSGNYISIILDPDKNKVEIMA